MATNRLMQRLADDRVALGLANSYPAAGIIEGMLRGWDFVWIDGQHGSHDLRSIGEALRASAVVDVATLLRVPGDEPGMLGQYADLAPDAIMVPMVNHAPQAGRVVEALRYPPLGMRSFGGRRIYDVGGANFVQDMPLVVIAQIETVEAVDNAAAIAATEGIDGLFFGGDDMKLQMGLPMSASPLNHEKIRAAMEHTAHAATQAGKIAGAVAATPEMVSLARSMGYRLLAGGSDALFLRTQAAKQWKELATVANPAEAGR